MRLFLQIIVILVSCLVGSWRQTVEAEFLVDVVMPRRSAPVNYSSDPVLTYVDVAGLSSLDFGLKGCTGARIILLQEQNNFTDFLEIILGKDRNSLTQISECENDSSCEARNISHMGPMYCFGYITFRISFRYPMVTIQVLNGGFDSEMVLLISWTPSPEDNAQLDLINYIGFSNEDAGLSLLLKRDAETNACYVKDEEDATSLQQCGDNFFDEDLCLRCNCCYHEHRQPSCFYSKAKKEVQLNRWVRSIEELINGSVILTSSPSYVNENVSFMILVGILRQNFTYVIQFDSSDESIVLGDDAFEFRPRIPKWAEGQRLPDWFNSTLNVTHAEDETQVMEDYSGVELSHVYNDTGHFVVSFSVSGQPTLRDDRDNFTVEAFVEVLRRPTLAELVNFTWIVGKSTAFGNETTEFVFFIQNSFPNLSYVVDFGDESEFQIFRSEDIEATNSTDLPEWLLTDDPKMFSSINFTDAEHDDDDTTSPDFLSWPIHHFLLFDHAYQTPGNYDVSVNVSGYITEVNKEDEHVTSVVIDVQRRPLLRELVDGLVFVAAKEAYDKEAVSFAVLVENEHPSLYARVEFGDESGSLMLDLSQSVSAPVLWMSDGFVYEAHGMNDSEVEDFLNSTSMFAGREFIHSFEKIGTYNVTIVISGYHPVVLKSDNIRLIAEIKVKSRPTLPQAIGHSVLLVKSPVYVNESAKFLIGTEHFYPELTYSLNFGDTTSHILFKANHTPSLFDWNLNGYTSSDSFPVVNASGFRLETVEHVYKSIGSYSALFYVAGALKVVRNCDTVFKTVTIHVQRRPTLSEIIQNDVVMIAKNRVYTNQDGDVFLLLPSSLSNLSYVVNCGDGLAVKAVLAKPLIKIPDWITSGKDIAASIQNPVQLISSRHTTSGSSSSFFSAATSCRYNTSNNNNTSNDYSITLTVSGTVGAVREVGFHRLLVPVSVVSRPTLSEEIGRVLLFVRRPVYVSEETNIIVAVENYFPKLQHAIKSAEKEVRLSKGNLVFRQNASLPDWLEKRDYCTLGNFSNGMTPSGFYWAEMNVTFLKSKSFNVTFSISGKLDIVNRWESVVRSIEVVAVELPIVPKLSDLLKNKCLLINTTLLIVDEIIGFAILCGHIDHQEHFHFSVDFGDNSSDKTLLLSSNFLLPNWIRGTVDPILWMLQIDDIAQLNGTRSPDLYKYNGADFYHLYDTAGARQLQVTVSADVGFRVKDQTELIIIKHEVLVEPAPVQPTPETPKCRPHSVSIRGGGGISSELPRKFSRNVPIRLEAVTHSDCLIVEDLTFVWEIREGEGHSMQSRVLSSSSHDQRKLTLDAYSLSYGKYKIVVQVSMGNSSVGDLIVRDETWLSIEPSPLHVELFGGPVVVTDYFRDVTLTAVNYEDVDEHPNIRSTDPVFTWFCTGPNEELPLEPLNRRYQGNSGGCFGKGLQLANGTTSPSLLFRSDHTVFRTLPAIFIVHVFITKPSRPPTSNHQTVVVLQKGAPLIRIVCQVNCDEFLNVDERLVLNVTCHDCSSVEKLVFLWELESICQQNAIKEFDGFRNFSRQGNANQLIVDPGVFSVSAGASMQYRFKVTVTRQERSQASAVYSVRTRSQPQGNPPSQLSKDIAAESPVVNVEAMVDSSGYTVTTPSCLFFHLILLPLLSVILLSDCSDGRL